MSDQALAHPALTASPAAPSTTHHWRTEDWIAVVLGFLVITEAASAENRVVTRDNLSKVAYVGIGLLIVATLGIALIGARLPRRADVQRVLDAAARVAPVRRRAVRTARLQLTRAG